jgi:hypothetical protein
MLTKILAKASASRRSIRNLDKMTGSDLLAIKKPVKKGLTGGALKKQYAIRQAYSEQGFNRGYEAAKNKTGYGKTLQQSFADDAEMKKYLYKKTPKTQMALTAAKYGTAFGAGGYFLNREDENEE